MDWPTRAVSVDCGRIEAVTILFCRRCDYAHNSVGDQPLHCPQCKLPTRWGTTPPHMLVPANPIWQHSENDLKLLKALKIDPA
jgi:hypothetical protein